MHPKIIIAASQIELLPKAESFAQSLHVSCYRQVAVAEDLLNQADLLLLVTADRLEVYDLKTPNSKAVFADFLDQDLQRRRWQFGKKALLAKAVGAKAGKTLHLLDATAGFGEDAFLLASLGVKVLMLERSPLVAALLEDALRRAFLRDLSFRKLSLQFIKKDALVYLQKLKIADCPDVIYLDPMYPPRSKSALGKKRLRLLKTIVGEDVDADKLFVLALKRAKQRVVVKRPRLAPPLLKLKPDLVFSGASVRFDVYFAAP